MLSEISLGDVVLPTRSHNLMQDRGHNCSEPTHRSLRSTTSSPHAPLLRFSSNSTRDASGRGMYLKTLIFVI